VLTVGRYRHIVVQVNVADLTELATGEVDKIDLGSSATGRRLIDQQAGARREGCPPGVAVECRSPVNLPRSASNRCASSVRSLK
jgi:hypothetical protein